VSLTGVPLIVVAVLVTTLTIAATWWLWSRYGRWRLVSRVVGILLAETLSVFTIGLVVNRVEQFYPSWQVLTGNTGTAVVAAARRAGRIDALVHGHGAAALPWRPASVSAWRLVATPVVVVPAGYLARRSVTFPVVLSLVDAGPDRAAAIRAAKRVATVSVVVAPSAGTTAAALATLPANLDEDVRATTHGWAIVATARQAVLAVRLIRSAPSRFGALVLVEGSATARPPQDRPGGEVAVAVVRPAPRHGVKAPALPPGTAALTSGGSPAWTTAMEWAAGECPPSLAAPVQLPPTYAAAGKPRRS
jgi:lysyl-tRNA synthetase class 2